MTGAPLQTPKRELPRSRAGWVFLLCTWLIVGLASTGGFFLVLEPLTSLAVANAAATDHEASLSQGGPESGPTGGMWDSESSDVQSESEPSSPPTSSSQRTDTDEPSSSRTTSRPSPAPTTRTTTEPSADDEQQPTSVTVVNTCGKDGNGDCFLTERSGPSASNKSLRRWDEGDSLEVVCQVHGDSARSTVLGTSSDVWSKTSSGGYVATIFLDGVDKYSVTTPC